MTNDPESTNAQLLASAELCGRLRYNASIWQRKADDDHPLVKDQLDAANAIDRLAYQAQGYCKDAKHAESVADELRRLLEKEKERADKFMWQVRDTCARAEAASLIRSLAGRVEAAERAAASYKAWDFPRDIQELTVKLEAAETALAAEKRAKEDAERERDSWKAVCRKAGVCMSCAIAMPDPHGCFDCLNTGWEGGAPKGSAPEKIVTPLHSDGEPLSMEGAIAANRPCATHCTVCEGEEHHWLDECADEGDPIQVCKHCNAWRPFGDDADD